MSYRSNRKDAKELSRKNRFAAFDPDIASRYDDDDDRPATRVPRLQNLGRIINQLKPDSLRRNRDVKQEQQIRGAAGMTGKTDLVNKIRIPGGERFGLQWIIRKLSSQIEEFRPLLPTITKKKDIEFFLRSDDVAEAVEAVSKRIVHKDSGNKIIFLRSKGQAPWAKLSKQEVDTIHAVVDSHYDAGSRALYLTEFALDPVFRAKDMHMALSKGNVMLTVIERIDARYGGLTALSLKGNRLRQLDFAAMLVNVCKFMSVLDLSDNQIGNIEQLNHLKGLPIKTLFFEGNPVCEQLTRITDYLNAIHQVFPQVSSLDGSPVQPASLTPLIPEDISNEPPLKAGFYGNNDLKTLVETFVHEYFKQYDGEEGAITRKNLMDAYDKDDSTLTITIANLSDTASVRYHNDDCYATYARLSHNVLQQEKFSRNRSNRTLKGAMEIVVQLAKLPITNHYRESFIVDVHLITTQLLGFTVQGLFEDGELAKPGTLPTLNYFSRSFVVAPRGAGAVAVLSDMLFISGITTERMARYKVLLNKCISAPVTVNNITDNLNSLTATAPPEDVRKAMVEKFSIESGMLPEWSLKCLEDSNWDYQVAGQQFLSCRGQIPKEAFAAPQ
ncbi:unnamed protein product [Auanema sp. JU1783]|nr:unnamed protein product [Auanema sp. JU1783]